MEYVAHHNSDGYIGDDHKNGILGIFVYKGILESRGLQLF